MVTVVWHDETIAEIVPPSVLHPTLTCLNFDRLNARITSRSTYIRRRSLNLTNGRKRVRFAPNKKSVFALRPTKADTMSKLDETHMK